MVIGTRHGTIDCPPFDPTERRECGAPRPPGQRGPPPTVTERGCEGGDQTIRGPWAHRTPSALDTAHVTRHSSSDSAFPPRPQSAGARASRVGRCSRRPFPAHGCAGKSSPGMCRRSRCVPQRAAPRTARSTRRARPSPQALPTAPPRNATDPTLTTRRTSHSAPSPSPPDTSAHSHPSCRGSPPPGRSRGCPQAR